MKSASGTTKWPFVDRGGSDKQRGHTSRAGVDAKRLIDPHLPGLRLGRLAHMQGAPVGTAEGGSEAHLAGERLSQHRPTGVDALRLQVPADQLHELIGECGKLAPRRVFRPRADTLTERELWGAWLDRAPVGPLAEQLALEPGEPLLEPEARVELLDGAM
jgi:hypothetical protein